MTTNAVSGLNCMGDCMVLLQVTNMPARTSRVGAYAIKVPFASLSQTMQSIHRSGGKVTAVDKLAATDTLADLPAVPTPVYTSTKASTSAKSPAPAQQQDRQAKGGKHKK